MQEKGENKRTFVHLSSQSISQVQNIMDPGVLLTVKLYEVARYAGQTMSNTDTAWYESQPSHSNTSHTAF